MENIGKSKPGTKWYILSATLLVILILSVLFYFQNANRQTVKFANLKYGEDPRETLDIYAPRTQQKKLPIIFYGMVAAGRGGDKENIGEKPSYFVNQGYVFVSVNYRLYPKANYKDIAADLISAIKWIVQHQDQYPMDGSRIHLMGHSSGGHLVMLIGTNPKYLSSTGLSPHVIKSIINLEGPIDLADFFKRLPNYKKVFGEDEWVWSEASPITYATSKNLPPMFLVTRRKSTVSAFLREIKDAGNTAELFEVKTLSHS